MKKTKVIVAEISYDKVWEDQLYIAVYQNEVCMEHERFDLLNMNASKKMLIKEIGNVSEVSADIMFVLDNIVQLKRFTVLNYCKKAMIIVGNNLFTVDISENLLNIIKKLAHNK